MPASPATLHEWRRRGAQEAGESVGARRRRVDGGATVGPIGVRTSAPPNGPIRRSRSTQRRASHAGIHGHPAPGQPPRQPRASEQRTRSEPTHLIRRGAMPTDRVYRHRQQAQTRKRAVNAGTTRPPQARRSSTRSGLNATPQNPGLHNVSVTWARQVVALTLSCAAGPDTWSMGTPAHTPPIGLTCASKGPGIHPSGRTCHPTAGRARVPQHVLQPHIGTVVHRARHSPNHAAHSRSHQARRRHATTRTPQAHAPSPPRSRPPPAASCAHTARPGPAAQTSAPAPAS